MATVATGCKRPLVRSRPFAAVCSSFLYKNLFICQFHLFINENVVVSIRDYNHLEMTAASRSCSHLDIDVTPNVHCVESTVIISQGETLLIKSSFCCRDLSSDE